MENEGERGPVGDGHRGLGGHLATAGRPLCGRSCTKSGGGCATITDCGLGAVNGFKEGQTAVGRARLRNPSDAYPRRLQAQPTERDGGRFRRPAPPRSGSKPVLSMDLRWDTLSCPGSVGVGRCRGSSGRLVGRPEAHPGHGAQRPVDGPSDALLAIRRCSRAMWLMARLWPCGGGSLELVRPHSALPPPCLRWSPG